MSSCAFAFMIMVHIQVPDPTDECQALPGSSWSFPRWPAELLPVSGLASLPGPRPLAGHTDWGLGTPPAPRTKEQLFGGHLNVLGPAVLLPNWDLVLLFSKIWQDLARSSEFTFRL